MHDPLIVPDDYIASLEEVLGASLGKEAMHDKSTRKLLTEAAEVVQQISEGLTQDRDSFVNSKYLKKQDQRKAYLLYYVTTNFLKLWPPLRELAQSGFFDRSEIRHLDIGSGPGTAAFGLWSFLDSIGCTATCSSLLTDSLSDNLIEAEKALRTFAKRVKVATSLATTRWDLRNAGAVPEQVQHGAQYDIITMMNVINELPEDVDDTLIHRLLSMLKEDGAIVMIEPSTRELSRRALRFRDRMVAHEAFVYAPCTKYGGCPALVDADNWCHTDVRWERPAFIKFIDELAGTLRLSLKYTYGVFLKQDKNLSDLHQEARDFHSTGRIVSEVFLEKGRTRLILCNQEGRREHVMNKRDKAEQNRDIQKAERYDLVVTRDLEVREHDVKVTEGSVFNIKSDFSGAPNVDKWG
jgi:ribosomal protein RSM22 (predicted rRNA methylase)